MRDIPFIYKREHMNNFVFIANIKIKGKNPLYEPLGENWTNCLWEVSLAVKSKVNTTSIPIETNYSAFHNWWSFIF